VLPPGCLRPKVWSRSTQTVVCGRDRDLQGHPSLEKTTHNVMVRSPEAKNRSQMTKLKTDAVIIYEDRLKQSMIVCV
jgi:hypothetical protein